MPGSTRRMDSPRALRLSMQAFEEVDVNLPPGLILLDALRMEGGFLVDFYPALKVGHRARIGRNHFQPISGRHPVQLLLGLDDRNGALHSAHVELLDRHPFTLGLRWRRFPRRTGFDRAPIPGSDPRSRSALPGSSGPRARNAAVGAQLWRPLPGRIALRSRAATRAPGNEALPEVGTRCHPDPSPKARSSGRATRASHLEGAEVVDEASDTKSGPSPPRARPDPGGPPPGQRACPRKGGSGPQSSSTRIRAYGRASPALRLKSPALPGAGGGYPHLRSWSWAGRSVPHSCGRAMGRHSHGLHARGC